MNIFTEYSQDEYGFTWKYILMNIWRMALLYEYISNVSIACGNFSVYTDALFESLSFSVLSTF